MPNSGLGCLVIMLLIGLLLGAVGLGWIVNGFLIFLALILITPVIAWIGLNWWLQRNLVSQPCPVCGYEFTSLNNSQCECPNCGELLEVKKGKLLRMTPPGIIDVTVVDE
ncbi:MAG: hypothetical protein EA365_02655 [Gloeocapsa sp. DLM2.Bin57]|nr:MAG: hypothetical protein EA365_02655 [Gloeocapsa sp. DLM2.Bin57]